VPDVQQKYAIYDENNNLVEERSEKVTAVDGAGRFQSNSKFKLPAEAKGKNYTVKTSLVSNGKSYKENSYKVTLLDDQTLKFAALY
jgi:flagellar hook assembly protein FlgD